METEKILKLVEAGFTADEIRGFLKPAAPTETITIPNPESSSQVPLSPEQEAAGTPGTAAAAAPAEEKKDTAAELKNIIDKQIADSMRAYQDRMTNVLKLAGMPALDNVQPKGIDDIIDSFFKEEN